MVFLQSFLIVPKGNYNIVLYGDSECGKTIIVKVLTLILSWKSSVTVTNAGNLISVGYRHKYYALKASFIWFILKNVSCGFK